MNSIRTDVNLSEIIKSRSNSFTLFDGMLYAYKKFLDQMGKSDFKNASTRYVAEYQILRNLYKQAEQDAPETLEEILKRINEVTEILKTQGVRIKD